MKRAPDATWKRSFKAGHAALPVCSDDRVFASSCDARVHAIDAGSGKGRWIAVTPGGVASAIAVDDDGGLLFYSGVGGAGALGRDGEILWTASGAGQDGGRLVVADGVLIEAAGDHIRAWDKFTGKELWTHELPQSATALSSFGGRVGVAFRSFEHPFHAGGFRELSATNGEEVRRINDVPAHLLEYDELGVVLSTTRQALAIYGANGTSLSYFFDAIRHERLDARRSEPWMGDPPKIAVVGDRLYVGDRDGVSALERSTGKLIWRQLNVGRRKNAGCKSLVASPDFLVQVAFKTYLMDPATGEPIWAVTAPATWAALGSGQLHVGTQYAISSYPLPLESSAD